MRTLEQIFDEEAIKGMVQYEPNAFKRAFPILFRVIKAAMKTHTEQFLDKAADVSGFIVTPHDMEPYPTQKETDSDELNEDEFTANGFWIETDEEAILELKQQIK